MYKEGVYVLDSMLAILFFAYFISHLQEYQHLKDINLIDVNRYISFRMHAERQTR